MQRPLACRQRDLTGPPRRRSPVTTDSDEDGQRDKGEGEKVAGLDGGRKHADTPTCPTPRANGHYLTRSRSAATRSTIIHQCSTTNLHSSAGYRCGWLGGPESTRPPRVMRPGLQMHRTPGSGTVRPIAPTNRQASRTADPARNRNEAWSRSVMASALPPGARPKRNGLRSLVRSRSGAFPPVNRFCVGGQAVEQAGDEFGVRPPAAGETELLEVPGGTVIVVDRLIYGIGVDLAGAVAVDRSRDVAEQLGQLRLVVGAHTVPRGAPVGLGAHARDGTVFEPAGCGHGSLAATDAGGRINLGLPIAE